MTAEDPPRVAGAVASEAATVPDSGEPKRGRDGRRMHPASLANLRPGAGAWQPGHAPHLSHGARSRQPQGSPERSPFVPATTAVLVQPAGAQKCERALESTPAAFSVQPAGEQKCERALRDTTGELWPWAVPSVEAVALQRVAA